MISRLVRTGAGVGHACLLHDCCSDKDGHAAPPFRADAVMLRERVWVPPPHDLLHEPHADQPDTAQFTLGGAVGHACLLHDCCSDKDGHAAPPFFAGKVMLRVRVWVPPPHDLLHEPHADQPDTAQLTLNGAGVGHACLLQGCCSDKDGQAVPPFFAGKMMLRERVWVPPPHDLLHEPHADQPETAQFTLGGDVGLAVTTTGALGAGVATKGLKAIDTTASLNPPREQKLNVVPSTFCVWPFDAVNTARQPRGTVM